MKCPICNKNIDFLEWFRYNYSCEKCFKKNKENKKKVKDKSKIKGNSEKISKLKEQYPKRNTTALIYSGIFALLIIGPLNIIILPLEFLFTFAFIWTIIKIYQIFKYRNIEK